MRLLLDAHFAFWLALRRDKLTSAELAVISNSDNDIAVPSIAIWELKLKWDKRSVSGERMGEASPMDMLNVLDAMGVTIVELTGALASAELKEPIDHKDPFDELYLIIAQEMGFKLLTRDRKLLQHPLALAV